VAGPATIHARADRFAKSSELSFDELPNPGRREAMKLYKWSEIPEEQINPLASRQMIHTQTMSVVRRVFSKGAMTRLLWRSRSNSGFCNFLGDRVDCLFNRFDFFVHVFQFC
jgi:hypothetical protein